MNIKTILEIFWSAIFALIIHYGFLYYNWINYIENMRALASTNKAIRRSLHRRDFGYYLDAKDYFEFWYFVIPFILCLAAIWSFKIYTKKNEED